VRSYGQYCAVAKALDLIGDRWNLLIVRELLIRGACRYTDLQHGLPGIATNLLADRLRDLEAAGVLQREEAPPPVATTLFRLTDRGEALRPVLSELLRWGAPLMLEPDERDAFRSHWLGGAAELALLDAAPAEPAVSIELRPDGQAPVRLEVSDGAVRTREGPADSPALVLEAPPQLLLGVLTGQLGLEEATDRGLLWQGDPDALARVRLRAATPAR
jgi:DNA-binding HxlR family transcriptional regulator